MFLCISNRLLDEVHEDFHVARKRMEVSYMGVGSEFEPKGREAASRWLSEKHGVHEPYVLFVGQQQERKNVFRVIEAYAQHRKKSGTEARLLLVGRKASENGPITETIQRCGVEKFVTRIGYVAFSELPYLYSGAKMLVFPSLWEGFGIPVIESMACATPVVTSTATCLPEIAGDAALVVDPHSVEQIAGAMTRIECDGTLRSALIEKGLQRARLFSWENCARSTLNAYTRMSQEGR
jgi:glycosyltransferase involved in cell wall biosynthesis